MLNKIILMGRIVRDPEQRATPNGTSTCTFTIACERDFGEKQTDFIDCMAWRGTADFISKYFTKGSMIIIAGRLQIREWVDKDGKKHRSAEVVAENAYFGSAKTNAGGSDVPTLQELPDDADGDLPF